MQWEPHKDTVQPATKSKVRELRNVALEKDSEPHGQTKSVLNDEVRRRVEEEKSIISTIDKRQRAWLGHTLRVTAICFLL